MRQIRTAIVGVCVLLIGLSGCKVTIDRDLEGHDKVFKFDTPFGHFHINTDQTNAADIGLPVYPRAELIKNEDNHDDTAVSLGLGTWQLDVKTASYSTTDSQQKVATFYKQALGQYGTVITCQGKIPVGVPTTTSEGVSCDDQNYSHKVHINTGAGKDGINVNTGADKDSLQLRVGSKQHEHIVGFQTSQDGKTHFALVALDVPSDLDKGSGKSQ